MRIAGVRLEPTVARLLSELLEDAGFHDTSAKIADTIERGVTTETPLTLEDHAAILRTLTPDCPPTLRSLQRELLEEQRYVRRVTGG